MGRCKSGTVKHHLNTLSNLFRHAASERRVPTSYNPVRDLLDKPQGRREEARWLEVHEAALLLESCRTYQSARPDLAMPFLYPLVATYLLTGGRRREVLGLEMSDVNFERKVVVGTRWSNVSMATWASCGTVRRWWSTGSSSTRSASASGSRRWLPNKVSTEAGDSMDLAKGDRVRAVFQPRREDGLREWERDFVGCEAAWQASFVLEQGSRYPGEWAMVPWNESRFPGWAAFGDLTILERL